MKSFAKYISHSGSQMDSQRVMLDMIKMLEKDLETVGENGVLNIIDAAIDL